MRIFCFIMNYFRGFLRELVAVSLFVFLQVFVPVLFIATNLLRYNAYYFYANWLFNLEPQVFANFFKFYFRLLWVPKKLTFWTYIWFDLFCLPLHIKSKPPIWSSFPVKLLIIKFITIYAYLLSIQYLTLSPSSYYNLLVY